MNAAARTEYVPCKETAPTRAALARLRRELARSSRTGTAFQPLVICGPSGVGKSRLVADFVASVISGPAVRAAQVVPAHDLTPAPDGSPGEIDIHDLQMVDVLAIEDFQHLAKSARLPMARLLDDRARRRLATIITLTGSPNRLTVPERLYSRITPGLVTPIPPLGVESRLSIVRTLATGMRLLLTPEALARMVSQAEGGGLRSLLGQLDILARRQRGRATPVTVSDVQTAVPQVTTGERLDRILNRVAAHYGVTVTALRGPSRLATVLLARQVAMTVARDVAQLPLTRIGAALGGRDHTTVINSLKRIDGRMAKDRDLAAAVRELKAQV